MVLNAKEVEDRDVLSAHSKKHVDLIRNISSKQFDSRRSRIASKFNSIYFNDGSSEAASLAAGSVIEVVMLCFHRFSGWFKFLLVFFVISQAVKCLC